MSDWISYDNDNKRFIVEENLGGARTAKVTLHLIEAPTVKQTWTIHQKAYNASHIDYITIAGNDTCYWGDEYVLVVTASGSGITPAEMEGITLSVPSRKGLEIIDSQINGNTKTFRIRTEKKISINGSVPSETIALSVNDGEDTVNKNVLFKPVDISISLSGENSITGGTQYIGTVNVITTPDRDWVMDYVEAYLGICSEAPTPPEPVYSNCFTYEPINAYENRIIAEFDTACEGNGTGICCVPEIHRMCVSFSSKYELTALDVSELDTRKLDEPYMAYEPGSLALMFYKCTNLNTLNASGLVTDNVTDMQSMFRECSSLANLDLSGWDTSNVKDMALMFDECESLTNLDLSGWDTSNVKYMNRLFDGCSSLANLDLSGWDTSNVTNMFSMFIDCSSLTNLDLSGWDTSKVEDMSGMFQECSSLANLDLSGWDTSNVKNMSGMFGNTSLTNLDLSGWNTSKVEDMGGMFSYNQSLVTLDLSGWDVSKVESMEYMFYDCPSLTTLNVSGWSIHPYCFLRDAFEGCNSLRTIYARGCSERTIEELNTRISSAGLSEQVTIIS